MDWHGVIDIGQWEVVAVIYIATPNTRQKCQPVCPEGRGLGDNHPCERVPEGLNSYHLPRALTIECINVSNIV